MNVIFLGTIGIYHPTVAAHLYLGRHINNDFSPLCYWGDFDAESNGEPMLIGLDSAGNRIYSLGAGIEVGMTRKSIEQLAAILGHSEKELVIQPISVKAEMTIIRLYRAARLKILQRTVNHVVSYLLTREVDTINLQVKELQDRVRFD